MVGETTLMGAKVIELAGLCSQRCARPRGPDRRRPMFRTSAPSSKRIQDQAGSQRHQGLAGSAYMLKAAIEKAKSTDGKAIAAAMKNACFKVRTIPASCLTSASTTKG